MIFELGKEYIVKVSGRGIIPIDEFKSDRFYDKDHDDLDFLTDTEKTVVVNAVLDKIRAEIEAYQSDAFYHDNVMMNKEMVLGIIDKYRAESEE